MNINSYSSYSNSLLNPYSSVSNSQVVGGTQNIQSTQSPSQDTLKDVSQQSSQNIVNDFSVNISPQARQISLDASQIVNGSSESNSTLSSKQESESSLMTQQDTQQTLETRQTQLSQQAQMTQETQQVQSNQQTQEIQRTQQIQQDQQVQQMQSQFYQSPYGQVPLSRSSIDLMV
ncbi:MAG: hypothetical protein HQK72_03345 [Desulfamplus sp.]|nr:hypothetical protein [Desulfamplus sp.]